MKLEPLYTNKGSKIWYSSRHGIGKEIGGKIYVCREEAERIVPEKVFCDAIDILASQGFDYEAFNCVCYNLKNPTSIRFDKCEQFFTCREPVVGDVYTVDTLTNAIKHQKVDQLFHHKWLWVNPAKCIAFDVEEAYNWSKTWLTALQEPASGDWYKWQEQLIKYNVVGR